MWMFRWFFFCDTGLKIPAKDGLEKSYDDPCDRRRLLCWAILCTFVWAHISHSLLNFVSLVAFTVLLSVVVNLSTNSCHRASEIAKGACHFTLVIGLFSAVTILTCQPVYLRYEYLIQKMALKEYGLWRYWCPDTYITLVSITVISCVIRGIHRRLGLLLAFH